MEMYNVDGSRGAMCGNGIRCVAKYAVDRGLAAGPELTIETDSGVKRVWCRMSGDCVESVRVDMGEPRLAPPAIPVRLPATCAASTTVARPTIKTAGAQAADGRIVDHPVQIGGQDFRMTCLSMGNPHTVIFVPDVANFDLAKFGPLFEHAPMFPDRVNLHAAQIDSRDHVTMRTWERGSGATRACGTGACAVCVAGILNGKTHRAITATLPGGDLELEWSQSDNHVYMTGPAVEVFDGEWLGSVP
jgi:diaminopimelate epimerase